MIKENTRALAGDYLQQAWPSDSNGKKSEYTVTVNPLDN